jgi:hypothetical protein
VRNGRVLPPTPLAAETVDGWERADKPVLLLRLFKETELPEPVQRYLDNEAGQIARIAYKCRTRSPWYVVPDVQVPDFFLTYMSGRQPSLVRNDARCTCTNSVHGVRLKPGVDAAEITELWRHPIVRLSCELEGHPLGGGMLKLEPGEASRVILPDQLHLAGLGANTVEEATLTMRSWRHYAI